MTVVVGGASGFVGRYLVAGLRRDGRTVRCGSRRPERAASSFGGEGWVRLDLDEPDTLRRALHGARAYVHLVHHMRGDHDDLVAAEARSAAQVARIAEEAGLERVVFLGAPVPPGASSAHLLARARTGEVLRAGAVPCFELRASMIVGRGSESWLIVRDLALRLPFMVLPSWLRSRTQPVWIGDVVGALEAALDLDPALAGIGDLPGPETLTAEEILMRTAAQGGIRPGAVHIPVLTPSLSSHWIRWVTRADMTVARELVEGLAQDLVMDEPGFWTHCPDVRRTPFDEAVRRALADDATPGVLGRAWEAAARRVGRRP